MFERQPGSQHAWSEVSRMSEEQEMMAERPGGKGGSHGF